MYSYLCKKHEELHLIMFIKIVLSYLYQILLYQHLRITCGNNMKFIQPLINVTLISIVSSLDQLASTWNKLPTCDFSLNRKKGYRATIDLSVSLPLAILLKLLNLDLLLEIRSWSIQVCQHLSTNDLFVANRHGFMFGENLHHPVAAGHELLQSVDHGLSVGILYLDFQKTFDSVPYNHLFIKLEAYGIRVYC